MSLIKHTKNTLKFAKIIELVFKLKTKLLNGKYEKEIQEISHVAMIELHMQQLL